MSYAELTFKDRNKVKRWLQHQRLFTALELSDSFNYSPKTICDFGAGNGELCKLLAERYPSARIICYEPTEKLLNEARENLKGMAKIDFCQKTSAIPIGAVDLVFCLEVFEHLPPTETHNAIRTFVSVLKPDGCLIVGVPVEIGIPALYKGMFRMTRRFGAYDASIRNVFLSLLGSPPKNRPVGEIGPGLKFHFQHVGFDFRQFRKTLCSYFDEVMVSASPFAAMGSWCMPEVYFVTGKRHLAAIHTKAEVEAA